MIIKLYDLQDTISVKGSLDGAKLRRPEDTDIGFASPIEYEITIQKVGDNVWLRGPVSAELSLTCARCLEEFTFPVSSNLDIELLPRQKTPAGEEVELKTDEMNVYYFEGDEIDIDPYVFEEVMLDLPLKALCSDACKGICPVCGKNRNVEECGCEKTGTAMGEKLKIFLKDR